MRKIPEYTLPVKDLYRFSSYSLKSTVFFSALKGKWFDHFEEFTGAEEFAKRLGFHERNTKLALNALAGMGLLEKNKGRYKNTGAVSRYLNSEKDLYLGGFIEHVRTWHEQTGLKFEELVKNGPPQENMMNVADDNLWAESAKLSAVYQICGPAQYTRNFIKKHISNKSPLKMLELGGGAGLYSVAVAEEFPEMKGVIIEQEAVAKVTRKFIKDYGMEDRVTVLEGDYTKDFLGHGYDIVLASATLNFNKKILPSLFENIYDSMVEGGIFVAHQDGLKDERTQPACHVLEFMSAELYGGDFGFEQGHIADLMKEAGFSKRIKETIHSDFGDMDLDLGIK